MLFASQTISDSNDCVIINPPDLRAPFNSESPINLRVLKYLFTVGTETLILDANSLVFNNGVI
jgi:hypothetical protein